MMKYTFTLILTVLIISFVDGQALKSIGVKGGITVANQSWKYKTISHEINTKNRIGVNGAVAMEFLKSKYLSLVTEIGYTEKGHSQEVTMTTIDQPEYGTKSTFDTKFSYLELQPMIKAQHRMNKVAVYALLGLRLDYQVAFKSDFDFSAIDDDFNKVIYGLTGGLGAEYMIKSYGINAGYQYHYDFNKVLDIGQSATQSGIKVENRAFVVSLGVRYYFPKKEAVK